MNYSNLSPQLSTIAEKAIQIGLDTISTEKNKLYSFLVYGEQGSQLQRFVIDSDEEALNTALEFISQMDDLSSAAVYAYKDSITMNDGIFDAITIQIYGIDEEHGYSFSQVYRLSDKSLELLNEKLFMGKIKNALVF